MRYRSALWLVIGIIIYSLTAWFSEGYHHPDEHFQVLEFAHFILSPSPLPYSLAWEYEAQIRPGLQPFLAWCMMRVCSIIGVSSPFIQSFLLRWLTGLASLLIYYKFVKYFTGNQRVIALFAILFLWFMPYLSVRFSSEQTSGLAFLIGIYAILREPTWKNWSLAGLFFCLSFYLRYQIGFALLGAGIWLLWDHKVSKTDKKAWLGLIAGGFCGFTIGTMADFWLYQKWIFPYINYFTINILEDKAAQWGKSPFWYYPLETIITGIPPISVFFLGLAVWGAWKHRTHILVWSVVPFIVAHSLVGHKELRFMFPIVFPVLIFALWGLFEANYLKKYRVLYVLGWISIFINIPLFIGRSITAAQEAVPHLRFLYHYAEKKPCTVYVLDNSPYNLVGPEANYLKHPNIKLLIIKDVSEIIVQENTLFLSRTLHFPAGSESISKHRIFTYIPEWVLKFNPNKWQERSRIWSVWEVI